MSEDRFIREFATLCDTAIVRSRSYCHSIYHIKSMAAVLQKDFPELTEHDIEIVHYGGRHYSGTMGAEAKVIISEIPEEYFRKESVERTR